MMSKFYPKAIINIFIVTEDVFFKFDFLDPVNCDLPKKSWSL